MYLVLFFIASITHAYDWLSAKDNSYLQGQAKQICKEILDFAQAEGDTRLLEAHTRHCKDPKDPQLSGLIGAFYHMNIDLEDREPKKAAFYRNKFRELGLLTKVYPDFQTPPVKWDVKTYIEELSGFAYDKKNNELWVEGDSGTGPYIAKVDVNTAQGLRLKVQGVSNIDWESIELDGQGQLWVLDVGDNNKKRKNVRLYKINPKNIQGNLVTAEKFELTYAEGPMDCEGGLIKDDVLYLFEKVYFLEPRVYTVNLKERPLKAKLEGRLPKSNLITDASLSPEGRLFFLSYTGITEVEHWPDIKKAKIKTVTSAQHGQTEAIVALSPTRFWVGREDGKIFEINP